MAGEIKQMDVQLQKYNEQLRTEFKDAHEKYRPQHIKVKVYHSPRDPHISPSNFPLRESY